MPRTGPLFVPATVAVGVVIKDYEVLLVNRRDSRGGISWVFPGGGIEPGETPGQTVQREVLEETGVDCSLKRFLGVRRHPNTGVVVSYWECQWLAGHAHNREPKQHAAVRWATPAQARDLFIAPLFVPANDVLTRLEPPSQRQALVPARTSFTL